MISLLIGLLILTIIAFLVNWVLRYLGAPEPIIKVVTVLLVVIFVLYILGMLWPALNVPVPRLRP